MHRASAADSKPAWHERAAVLCVAGLLLSVPFLFTPTAAEAFRAPKLWASDVWGLASLLFLAFGLRRVDSVAPGALWRVPAMRAAIPLVVLAVVSRFTSSYPLGVSGATTELAIGAACLIGWSVPPITDWSSSNWSDLDLRSSTLPSPSTMCTVTLPS